MKTAAGLSLLLLVSLFLPSNKQTPSAESNGGGIQYLFGELNHHPTVNEMGAFMETIPIDLPMGVNEMVPKLALVYSSSAPAGILGQGFNLSGISHISRIPRSKANHGDVDRIRFNDLDGFALDGQFLTLIKGTHTKDGAVYRTENETFSLINAKGNYSDGDFSPKTFEVKNKQGWIYFYGNENEARVVGKSGDKTEVLTWSLTKMMDPHGNYVTFHYDNNGSESLIRRIDYTHNDRTENGQNAILAAPNHVEFHYKEISTATKYLAGNAITKNKLLERIEISTEANGGNVFKRYMFNYKTRSGEYFLQEILECDGNEVSPKCHPPLRFNWGEANYAYTKHESITLPNKYDPIIGDLDGDGQTDLIVRNNGKEGSENVIYSLTKSGWKKYDNPYATIQNQDLIANADNTTYSVVDINNDGFSDIIEYTKNQKLITYKSSGFIGHFHFDKQEYEMTGNPFSNSENRFYLSDFKASNEPELILIKQNGRIFLVSNLAGSELKSEDITPGGIAIPQVSDQSFEVGDFDGDGKPELLYINKNSQKANVLDFHNGSFRTLDFGKIAVKDKNLVASDVNKDGNVDLISYQNNKPFQIHISTGNAFNEPITTQTTLCNYNTSNGNYSLNFTSGTFSGSGNTQFLTAETNGNYHHVELIDGKVVSVDLNNPAFEKLQAKSQFIPVNASDNGISDLLIKNDKTIRLYTNGSPIVGKVVQVEGNFGKKWKVNYAPISDGTAYTASDKNPYNGRFMRSGMVVVKRLVVSNGIGSFNTVDYAYSNLLFRKNDRGLAGFESRKTTDETSRRIHVQNYSQTFPLNGKLIRERTYSFSGELLFDKRNEWRFNTYHKGKLIETANGSTIDWSNLGINQGVDIGNLLRNLNIQNKNKSSIGEPNFNSACLLLGNLNQLDASSLDFDRIRFEISRGSFSENTVVQSIKTINKSGYTYLPLLETSVASKFSEKTEVSRVKINQRHDRYGFLTESNERFLDGSSSKVEYVYEHIEDNNIWILGLVKQKLTGTRKKDSEPFENRITAYKYNSLNGAVEQKIVEPNLSECTLTETYTYDACGNVTSTKTSDSKGVKKEVRFRYESKYKRYVTQTTNTLGHTLSFIYDPRFGNILQETDPNGISKQYHYNALGVLTKKDELKKEHSNPLISTRIVYDMESDKSVMGKFFPNVAYSITTYTTGVKPQTAYFDQLGREIVKKEQLIDQSDDVFVIEQVQYDRYGQIAAMYGRQYYERSHDPRGACLNFDQSDIKVTEMKYDELGRLYETILPDGEKITKSYGAFEEVTTNALDQRKIVRYDQKGAIVENVDNEGNVLKYTYNSWGQVETVKKDEFLLSKVTYDLLGRKIKSEGTNGVWEYTYDAFGNLYSEHQEGSEPIIMTYDKIGRMLTRTSADGTATWVYDSNYIGLESSSLDENGNGSERKYDVYGRLIEAFQSINGELFNEKFSYNSDGLVSSRTINNDVTLNYHYTNGTLVKITQGTREIWKLNSIQADGNVLSTSTGNGYTTTSTYTISGNLKHLKTERETYGVPSVNRTETWCERTWGDILIPQGNVSQEPTNPMVNPFFPPINPNPLGPLNPGTIDPPKPGLDVDWTNPGEPMTRQKEALPTTLKSFALTSIPTIENGNVIQDQHFNYNELYNVVSREDRVTKLVEKYDYDALNRLDKIEMKSEKDGYRVMNLSYDALGNILHKSGQGYYQYDANQPYQLSIIDNRQYGGTVTKFTYDDRGNIQKNGDTKLTYNAFNRVISLKTKGHKSTRTYDVNHRLIKTEHTGDLKEVVLQPFVDFEIRKKNGKEEFYYYIFAGDKVVAFIKKTEGSAKTYFFHHDRLGSVEVITDDLGAVQERYAYDAFGKRTSLLTTDTSNPFGYTSHRELLEYGLIDMKGRIYSPDLGRFLSTDPYVSHPDNLQAYNRYSYVLNNPYNLVDPSGFFFKKIFRAAKSVWDNTAGKVWKEVERGVKKYGKQIVIVAVSVAVTAATGGAAAGLAGALISGALAGAAASATAVLLNGGDFNDMIDAALTGAATGALSAGMTYGIGSAFGHASGFTVKHIAKTAAHGVSGGIMSEIRGGDFKSGFMGAAVTQAFNPSISSIDRQNMGVNLYRTTAAALVGGASSAAAGGDFVAGALSASFSRAYNDDSHWKSLQKLGWVASAAGTIMIAGGKMILASSIATGPIGAAVGGIVLAAGYTGAAIGYGIQGASFVNDVAQGNYGQATTSLLMFGASRSIPTRYFEPSAHSTINAVNNFRGAQHTAIDYMMTFDD